MSNPDTTKMAVDLLAAVTNALASGALHYDIHGNRLTTPKAVLEALIRDGSIEFKEQIP